LKLSKQITLGYALMFFVIILISGFSIHSIYRLDKAASNLEGRYTTLYKLISKSSNKELTSENEKFGSEMIDQALSLIDQQVKRSYTNIFLVVGIALLFSGAIAVLFPKKITKPILRLVNATKSVGSGEYSYRVENLGGSNEIDELISSFNKMLQNIQVTHEDNVRLLEQTKRFNEVLEEKIEEATKDIKEMQNELIKTERLATIGEVAAKIAHEIKNPLSGISIALELMKNKTPDDEQRQKVSEILSEVARLDRIIKDMLQIAKPPELYLRNISPNEIVEKAIALVSPKADERRIKIDKNLNCRDSFYLDAEKIEQVIINLLLNGIDSINGTGGKIIVETEILKNELYIKVSDSGCGFPEVEIEKLFQPFYSTKRTGTGLGLAISKRIIESHRGRIIVSSEVGKGSIFTLVIPDNLEDEYEAKS
jgi:two-component system NtrC family sensor kinase